MRKVTAPSLKEVRATTPWSSSRYFFSALYFWIIDFIIQHGVTHCSVISFTRSVNEDAAKLRVVRSNNMQDEEKNEAGTSAETTEPKRRCRRRRKRRGAHAIRT